MGNKIFRKDDLIERYAELTGASKSASKEQLNAAINVLKQVVIEEGGFDYRGFIKIETKLRKPFLTRNPKTGVEVQVPAEWVPKVKISETFKREINEYKENEK